MSIIKEDEVTHKLEAKKVFNKLKEDETEDGATYRAYTHHLSRACWHGARVIFRQTSPESEGLFEYILELHRACDGHWEKLLDTGLTLKHLRAWLEFAGMFLSSLGNHYGDGDQKVVPNIPKDELKKMATVSPEATSKLYKILDLMLAAQPSHLGYPSKTSQSGYYIGKETVNQEEVETVTKLMEARKIAPENTRLIKAARTKSSGTNVDVFEILVASAEVDAEPKFLADVKIGSERQAKVFLRRGDHSVEMNKICASLTEASKHAANETQRLALSHLIETFRTGDYNAFHAAQKVWVQDKAPKVEHCLGFLFGYRDPCGVRAEWQASTGIADSKETKKMHQLVEKSVELICSLPWAVPGENNGKGPFEPNELVVPDFAVLHVVASLSSTVWEATNITLDDEDGKRHGVKNMIYLNRMNLNSRPGRPCYYVDPSESKKYMKVAHICRFISTAIHELIGHGTGKLLTETSPGKYNFDHTNPPISPVTNEPIKTWYKPGENFNSIFGKLAPSVEECRAFLIADFLTDNKEILALFGYDEESTPSADDLIYYTYLEIGVEGLRSLSSFNAKDQTWGGDHDRAKFTILKHLVQDSDGFMKISHDPVAKTLLVQVDRSRILSHGKPSIGRMMTKIHIWHSTADVEACRPYYESLSTVDGEYEVWRQIVISNPEPKWKFVQPNTFVNADGEVEIREYEASNAGIIKSFFERDL